jgi:hypothetical protein
MKLVLKSKTKGYVAIHGVGVEPIVLTKEGEKKVFETEGLYTPYADHAAGMIAAGVVELYEEGKEPAQEKPAKEVKAEAPKVEEPVVAPEESAAPAVEESKPAKGKKK